MTPARQNIKSMANEGLSPRRISYATISRPGHAFARRSSPEYVAFGYEYDRAQVLLTGDARYHPRLLTLRSTLSTPAGKRLYVRRLFATIADRYDFIARFLSYGQDRRWKQRLIGLAAVGEDDRVLDLACGTGDLLFAAASRVRYAVGLDVTLRMLQLAELRRAVKTRPTAAGRPLTGRRNVALVVGDMLAL